MKKYIKNLSSGICISFIMSFMLAVFEPLILYFTNVDQFWYSVYILLPVQLLGLIVLFTANVVIYVVIELIEIKMNKKLKGRLSGVVLLLESICFIAMYIQGNYLAGNLPSMDGSAVDWSTYGKDTIISLVLWIVVIVLVVGLTVKFGFKGLKKAVPIVSVCAFLMFMVTLTSVGLTKGGFVKKLDMIVTSEGLMQASTDKNMIIFLIDAASADECENVIKQDSELRESFNGFTMFKDAVGAYPFTEYSIPFILGGQWSDNSVDLTGYSTKNLTESPLIEKLKKNNYSIGLYEDELKWEDDSVYDCNNVAATKRRVSDTTVFIKKQIKYSLYKYMPYGVKQKFQDDLGVLAQLQEAPENAEIYSFYNCYVGPKIKSTNIETTDDKVFRFIHIEGAHTPFSIDENGDSLPSGTYSDYYVAIRGSFALAKTYIEKLKASGVYDNSAIIIMADHGFNADENAESRTIGRQNPLLMIKGIDEHHALEYSEAPVSYDDLQLAYERLLDGRKSSEVFDCKAGEQRDRRYLFYYYLEDDHMIEYVQKGKANNNSTMVATGKEFKR